MEPLGDAVRRELARFGPAAGMTEIVSAWPVAVGSEIARNAWPARLARDRTLHVSTSSAAWAFELGHLEEQLLARLREAAAEAAPKRLRFAVGPLPEVSPEPSESAAAGAPTPTVEQLAKARDLAAGIGDEELRKVVAKAAAASLARGSGGRSVW